MCRNGSGKRRATSARPRQPGGVRTPWPSAGGQTGEDFNTVTVQHESGKSIRVPGGDLRRRRTWARLQRWALAGDVTAVAAAGVRCQNGTIAATGRNRWRREGRNRLASRPCREETRKSKKKKKEAWNTVCCCLRPSVPYISKAA